MPNLDLNTLFGTMPQAQGGDSPMLSTLQGALQGVEGMQPPTPEAVPPALNPFGTFASTFASSLAEAMGQHGAGAQNQERIAAQEQDRMATVRRNAEQQSGFIRQKQTDRLGIMLKIGEAKQEMYMQQQDMNQAEKQANRNFMFQTRLQKLKQEGELEQQKVILGRQLSVEGEKQKGRMALAGAKEDMIRTRYGNDPRSKALLAEAQSKKEALIRAFEAKYRLTGTTVGTYQERAFTQPELDAAESKLGEDISGIYDKILGELSNQSPPEAPGSTPTKKASAADFFK